MRKAMLPILLAFLLAATAAGGDPSPSTAKLIEQLGSKDFTKREQASRLLQARGPAVLPALRKALKHPDTEVRRRVGALIPVLEAVAALAPRRITLNAEQQPLADVLKEIEKQTGYKVAADDIGPKESCTIRLRAVPFWEALEQIGAQTGRAITVEGSLHLNKRLGRPPFILFRGPFRLEATEFEEERHIDFTQPGNSKKLGRHEHLLTLTLSIISEPRFILLSVGPAQLEAALDNNRKSLRPVSTSTGGLRLSVDGFYGGLRKEYEHRAKVLLQRSTWKSNRIKELRGFIPVRLTVYRKPVVVSDNIMGSKRMKCHVGASVVEIDPFEGDETRYILKMTVPKDPDVRGDLWWRRVHLEDAQGHRYSVGECRASGDSLNSISLVYPKSRDPKLGPPRRLIVDEWTILHHTIPFEFKDVPLP